MPRKKIEEPEVSGQDEAPADFAANETTPDEPIAHGDGDVAQESAENADAENAPAVGRRRTSKRISETATTEPLGGTDRQDGDDGSDVSELSSELSAADDSDEEINNCAPELAPEGYTSEYPDVPDTEVQTPDSVSEKAEESADADMDSSEPCPADTDYATVTALDTQPLDYDEPAATGEQDPEIPEAPTEEKVKPARMRKKTIYDLNLNSLDRDLTPEERQEWSSIYASYRSKSILEGTVIGADEHTFDIRNRETGEIESKTLTSLIIINYRVKVLIPESEMWMPGEERPNFVLRNMTGSVIDYAIIEIDREGQCAIGSRRVALAAKRHYFATARGGHPEGELLKCRVLISGPHRCTVETGGYDIRLSQRDLSYTTIPDLRERFHPGQELNCRLKSYDRKSGQLLVSVKEASPNPFIGADMRHPVGSRRQAVISGKYAGGVFCTMPDDTVCLCLYSVRHSDIDFSIGDKTIILIRSYDYDRQLIYGRILSKW